MREPSLNVLFAASEMAPLIKTGGLADVAGALTLALKELGCGVRMVLPRYGALSAATADAKVIARTELQHRTVEILETTAPQGQTLWLVSCPALFDRDGDPYVDANGRDWPDNAERFALVQPRHRMAFDAFAGRGVHTRRRALERLADRARGSTHGARHRKRRRRSSPYTISPIKASSIERRSNASSFPPTLWSIDGMEFHGAMSFIKGGIAFAERMATVSPTTRAKYRRRSSAMGSTD